MHLIGMTSQDVVASSLIQALLSSCVCIRVCHQCCDACSYLLQTARTFSCALTANGIQHYSCRILESFYIIHNIAWLFYDLNIKV